MMYLNNVIQILIFFAFKGSLRQNLFILCYIQRNPKISVALDIYDIDIFDVIIKAEGFLV